MASACDPHWSRMGIRAVRSKHFSVSQVRSKHFSVSQVRSKHFSVSQGCAWGDRHQFSVTQYTFYC